jgi:cobalt-zinc-cadmium efflux system membrane fusion protein
VANPHNPQAGEPVPPDAPELETGTLAPARAWPLPAQGMALLVFAGALVAALFVLPALVGVAAPGAPDDDAPAAAFKPTSQQWAGLKIRAVTQANLAPVVDTEGRIALDDNFSTPIFSPYSGRVTRVIAQAGDVVAAGAPLFAVISPELAQAENDMISALATLNEARQHQLFLGRGAALKDWQQSRVDLANAQGGYNSAQIAVSAVRSRMAVLGMSHADIQAIETTPDPERLLADIVVRAPIAGTITQRALNPGQNIVGSVASAGAATAIYTIADLRHLWMIANARETDAPAFHVGDTARVQVPAFPGRNFDARISYVAPVIDPSTHRLLVRADIANPDLALKPDMLATFEITTAAPAPTLAVPLQAVVYEGANAHVWLADQARKTLALRDITVGPVIGGLVEVPHGLTAQDSVVTSGAVFIDRALNGD